MPNTSSIIDPLAPSLGDGAQLLARFEALGRAHEETVFELVDTVDAARRSGTCEAIEGLPFDLFLGLALRLTGADRWMLLTAGEVLRDLPATKALWAAGRLSWSQIRRISARVARLRREDRAGIDARIAASVDDLDKLDPDQLGWAVDRACDEADGARVVQAREAGVAADEFVAAHGDLFGGGRLYAGFGPVNFAKVIGLLDRNADTPSADTPRARQRAAALITVAERDAAGANPTRAAQPSLVARVDLSQATVTAAGTVEINVPGWLPTLTARAVESLAASADVQAVLFDGARPLAEGAKLHAATIPAAIRRAVATRDQGDRFPGSTTPLAATEPHHTHAQAGGGDHHPDGLASLGRRGHRLTHRHGWTITHDLDTGAMTFTHPNGRTWTTLPRGTQLRRPPPAPPTPD